MQKILIGMPNFDHKIYVETAFNLVETVLAIQGRGDQVGWVAHTSPFITLNRNRIMQKGLDYDWILMMDCDIQVATPDFIYKMIETAYKYEAVITGLVVQSKKDGEPEYMTGNMAKDKSGYVRITNPPRKITEVDVVGAGVTLIQSRWIRDNLEQPYYEFKDSKAVNTEDGATILPEDWHLCEKIKARGGKIVIDPTIETIHWGIKGWHYQINK